MRILFVGFPTSVHTIRWINQFADQGWDLHLFPSVIQPLHKSLSSSVHYYKNGRRPVSEIRYRLTWFLDRWPYHRGSGYARRLRARILPYGDPGLRVGLEQTIEAIQPDIIHSLEMQSAGYQVSTVREGMAKDDFPTWVMSCWGSDLYLYHRIAAHQERIRKVLTTCDFLATDCRRDMELARRLGTTAQPLPVIPAAGGFDMKAMSVYRTSHPPSQRRFILLKGYQNWAGRALVALQAIRRCADLLGGYKIQINNPNDDVVLAAELVSYDTGLQIECVPYSSHEESLRRIGRARIYLGLSISDGSPLSLLEAMALGAFPIQSCTACTSEWLEDGQGGLVVPPEDPEVVEAALRRALTEDTLVDRAAEINAKVTEQRASYSVIKSQAIEMYQKVYAYSRERRARISA